MMIVCGIMIFVGAVLIHLWLRGDLRAKPDDVDWNRYSSDTERIRNLHPYKDSIIIPIIGIFLIVLGIIQITYLVC